MSVETVQDTKAVADAKAGGSAAEPKKRNALGKGLESLLGPRPGGFGKAGEVGNRPSGAWTGHPDGGAGLEMAGTHGGDGGTAHPNGAGAAGVTGQLFSEAELAAAVSSAVSAAVEKERGLGRPVEIPIDKIERNPYQTRTQFDEVKLKELATSIRSAGVFQPVVVRALPEGRYQLIAGERRWRASQMAGKKTVPAVVRQLSDLQAMEMTVIENLQREDLNAMDQARAFDRLNKEFNLTQEEMQERTGKDRATIGNFMRLLRLPRSVQGMIEAGRLSMGHGRALLALEDRDRIESAAEFVAAGEMSVRTAELWIQEQLNPEQKARREKRDAARERTLDPNVREAQDQLQRALGLRVRIEDRKGKGRVIIEYSGVEDFDSLLEALGKGR